MAENATFGETSLGNAAQSVVARMKSCNLFNLRHVTEVARQELDADAFHEWQCVALGIQAAIYQLDFYYEQSRVLRPDEESPLWTNLRHELCRAPRQRDELIWAAMSDLRQYAVAESRIHAFDRIDPREFPNVVSLKCADVRIARGLVWCYGGKTDKHLLAFWKLLDECHELIEDLQDLAEDGLDWNFNFWLYTYMAGGIAEAGISGTVRTLRTKLGMLEASYRHLSLARQDAHRVIFRETLRQGCECLASCWGTLHYIDAGLVRRFGSDLVDQILIA